MKKAIVELDVLTVMCPNCYEGAQVSGHPGNMWSVQELEERAGETVECTCGCVFELVLPRSVRVAGGREEGGDEQGSADRIEVVDGN
jgi:hypothetical protein